MWHVEHTTGDAAELHARPLAEVLTPCLSWYEVERPALVLGSAQPDDECDREACRREGVSIVRRRSGGGAVLLLPGEVLWLDVVLPVSDPRWQPDIGRSTWWLGEVWAAALSAVGLPQPAVHRGPMISTDWSQHVCFAGTGPGEVLHPAGGKLVGISQRRTRHGARFQCALHRTWRPECYERLLVVRPPADALRRAAVGVDVDLAEVREAVTGLMTAG